MIDRRKKVKKWIIEEVKIVCLITFALTSLFIIFILFVCNYIQNPYSSLLLILADVALFIIIVLPLSEHFYEKFEKFMESDDSDEKGEELI